MDLLAIFILICNINALLVFKKKIDHQKRSWLKF